MKIFNRPPAIGNLPTLSDGFPPDPDVQEQVVSNQVKAVNQWNDTSYDMTLSNIINERDEERQARWQALAGAAVAFLVLLVGIIWTYNSIQHDRLVASQRAAAAETPYTPETIR